MFSCQWHVSALPTLCEALHPAPVLGHYYSGQTYVRVPLPRRFTVAGTIGFLKFLFWHHRSIIYCCLRLNQIVVARHNIICEQQNNGSGYYAKKRENQYVWTYQYLDLFINVDDLQHTILQLFYQLIMLIYPFLGTVCNAFVFMYHLFVNGVLLGVVFSQLPEGFTRCCLYLEWLEFL